MSFAEVVSVFSNPLARIFPDEEHSAEESHGIVIGHSSAKRFLPVSFVESGMGWVRVISARQATRKEQHDYEDSVTD